MILHTWSKRSGTPHIICALTTKLTVVYTRNHPGALGRPAGSPAFLSELSGLRQGDDGETREGFAAGLGLRGWGCGRALLTSDLRCKDVSAEGAAVVAEELSKSPAITSLNLWKNSVGAGGAQVIASALIANTTLRELDVAVDWGTRRRSSPFY